MMNAAASGTPIISSMGAGNKLDPTAFQVADIYSTSVCPLAKVMRRELKRRGIKALKVVYSQEAPLTPLEETADDAPKPASFSPALPEKNNGHKRVPGSPPVAGLIIAGEVIKDLALRQTHPIL